MSDYVQSTNFATKDSLPSGDPLKIVKGAEINTEFNNISVAIATKADLVSPAFTGSPTATTATPSDASTRIATTAYTDAAVAAAAINVTSLLFPVGSIYFNATNSTNPGTLLGFGTWASFGAGRVLIGFNASNTLFDTAEETGGSYDATLVSHTHSATSTSTSSFTGNALAGHAHTYATGTEGGTAGLAFNSNGATATSTSSVSGGTPSGSVSTTTSTTVASNGSSATNANLPPYITVYIWKRTA